MTCCGKQRQMLGGSAPAARPVGAGTPAMPPRHAYAYFEYTGNTGLTVTGPVTGRRYRFDGPGARVAVDPADKPSMAAVPNLRRVAGP
jgi:hypothetical protein